MTAAELTPAQVATVDPATLQGRAVATRVAGVRAVIGLVPTGFGPDLLCGELRTDDDRWIEPQISGRGGVPEWFGLLVAPATERGLGLLLAGLARLASSRPVRAVRRSA